jgi:ankyrin repeat protein
VAAVQALVARRRHHARSKGGLTPFLFAVRESQVGVVRALLASGAKVDDTIIGGPPPRVTNIGRVMEAPRGIGPSALMLAVGNAHFELATILMDAGADPNFAPQVWTACELSWVKARPGSNDRAVGPGPWTASSS